MVEEDTVAGVHTVGLPVVDDDPVCIELGDTIGTARVEWRGLALRSLHDLSVQLGRRSLVELDVFLQATSTDGVEEAERAERVNVT